MLFNKKPDETSTAAAPAAGGTPSKPMKVDPKNPGAETAMSIIAQGMRVVGDIECGGVLKIEGIVEGSIRGPRQLLLGRQGEVKGDVHARELVLGGRVEGTVVADERIELQGTGLVNGDVHTKNIVVLEGGRINGSVRMDESTPGASVAGSAGSAGSMAPRKMDVRPALAAS